MIGDDCDVRMKPVNAMIVNKKHTRNFKNIEECTPSGQHGLEGQKTV